MNRRASSSIVDVVVTPIGMPKVGTSMIEGRVVAWAVAVGDAVAAGQTVVVDAVPLPR